VNEQKNLSLGFNLRCDEGSSYPTTCDMLNDYSYVLDRRAAQTFMSQYAILLYNSHNLNPDQQISDYHWKHKNQETFHREIAKVNGIHIKSVSARLLPLQRVGSVKYDGKLKICLHKVCDSNSTNLKWLNPTSLFSRCLGNDLNP